MSLLSLIIALMAERSLSSQGWQFNYYYQHYLHFFSKNFTAKQGTTASAVFIILPVLVIYFAIILLDNSLIELLVSTAILIVCIGCVSTRGSYKAYLTSAFDGDETTAEMHHQQLLSDKNLPEMGFGQALVWLNYRYYIAIILFFTVFGAAGAVFYRLLTSVIEDKKEQCIIDAYKAQAEELSAAEIDSADSQAAEGSVNVDAESVQVDEVIHESHVAPSVTAGCQNHHDLLFWLDWLPVRITSFGYMLVGHFTNAMPAWLESLFDYGKPTYQVLTDVAEKSEDIMVSEEDCTSEPCLLVRLAKRNVLLVLALVSMLTLIGLVN